MGSTAFTEIEKVERETAQCMKCGFCTYVCPVYQEERIESGVARGKNELVKGLLNGDLELNRDLADRLYKCTACMACTESCPAKAPIPRIVVAARADAARTMGVRFPYGYAYRNLLTDRKRLGNFLRFGKFIQSAFLPKAEGMIRHLPSFMTAVSKRRQIPSIAPKFLSSLVGEITSPPRGVKKVMRVGYFPGCMNEFVLPDLGIKTVDFLTRHGVEVVMPAKQGCCGAAAFLGGGDFEAGRKVADLNASVFSGVDCIVTGCATCACTLKEYPRFLADTPERESAYSAFSGKIKHVSQFLTDVLDLNASSYQINPELRGKKLTWHDPCHLNRHLGVKEQPRRILKSLDDAEFVEMPNAERCCGMAGQFSLYYYELSQKIAEKKMDSIAASDADIVVTACPGCQFQLAENTARLQRPHRVMNLMDVLN
ncbi:MAG TPA: (Fe-S)-binding protein [Acidobacteriota bacterium]|nr:(Fe-S)-binding protein [Acidobacteriota bacterium]